VFHITLARRGVRNIVEFYGAQRLAGVSSANQEVKVLVGDSIQGRLTLLRRQSGLYCGKIPDPDLSENPVARAKRDF
jgi:hypothetical protein